MLSIEEVGNLLTHLQGTMWIIGALLYGAGLRLQECLELRVKDLDCDQHQIVVHRGKGQKDRVTMLLVASRSGSGRICRASNGSMNGISPTDSDGPSCRVRWIASILRLQQTGAGSSCSRRRASVAIRDSDRRRGHLHESVVQKAVAEAARAAGMTKRVGPHVMRHSCATHLLVDGHDIRTVQEPLGHADVRTTMTYLHVLNWGGLGVRSPFDRLTGRPPTATNGIRTE